MTFNLPRLSIIIPAHNEAGNLTPLIKRLKNTLTSKYQYQIIIVDDHSTDSTPIEAQELAAQYSSVKYHRHTGSPGKAFALLAGFNRADHPTIAMIDADLQYPPEVIPDLVSRIYQGAGVVVANRKIRHESQLRTFISRSFQFLFAKWLHSLDHDVQSGLKVFRKDILKHLHFQPTPWTFDLNLLLIARQLGYSIESIDITFAARQHGSSKVATISTSWEIGQGALKSKFNPPALKPSYSPTNSLQGFYSQDTHYLPFTTINHQHSAFITLSLAQKIVAVLVFAALGTLLIINSQATLIALLTGIITIYFVDVILNVALVSYSLIRQPQIDILPHNLAELDDNQLPTYTIFCPLYKEVRVLPQFVQAMNRLDYPTDKLEIKLLLEQDDKATITAAQELQLPDHFQLVIVPETLPKTKPKACNYGLLTATGEYAVIYDAEDIPDPQQLKKVILGFQQAPSNTACLQAKLNYYNPEQNLLTRLFTAEYSLWFELILTGLNILKAPLPLGGTSNHFKTSVLRQLKGWDAFNVTEDCDLGIRIAQHGYQTNIINSVTLEEANSHIPNWVNQRTRWIKGYMQTFLVHLRQWQKFTRAGQEFELISFLLIIGSKVAVLLINPLMWLLTLGYFGFRSNLAQPIEALFPPTIFYLGVFAMVVGNFLYLYFYLVALAHKGKFHLVKYAIFTPVYWLLMSAAAWISLVRLVVQPHHWFKTSHGLHLSNENSQPLQLHYA